jgi:hypothetical protein
MFAGIGIIGALASILASLLVSPPGPDQQASAAEPQAAQPQVALATTGSIAEELAGLRSEIAGQRAEIEALRAALGAGGN